MKNIDDLIKIGFLKIGNWVIGKNDRIEFKIKDEYINHRNLLYAFEINNIVKYIGITEITIKERMNNYKSGHQNNLSAGSTNKKLNSKIKKEIEENKNVNIYILKNDTPIDYYGYKINLSTGIEKSLIEAFDFNNNLWNDRGTNNKTNLKPIKKMKENIFQMPLRKHYYESGIIFIPKKSSSLSPQSSGINVIIEIDKNAFEGTFTKSGSKTIVNGHQTLKDWYYKNFVINDLINVEIKSPNYYILSKIK